jgi:hypothetical protein
MSLAMYAAPFDNDMMEVNETPIHRKRNQNQNQRTQKRYPKDVGESSNNSDRVNSILKTIHNLPEFDDLTNFSPPPPPISSGVEQTKMRDSIEQSGNGSSSSSSASSYPSSSSSPSSSSVSPYSSNQISNKNQDMNDEYSNLYSTLQESSFTQGTDYLKNLIRTNPNVMKEGFVGQNAGDRFMPNYSAMNLGVANDASSLKQNNNNNSPLDKYDLLMKKLNYMVTLLEQQQDEKTGHVTEEVILYSFLGIFIIFIVDSFARVGKYVR